MDNKQALAEAAVKLKAARVKNPLFEAEILLARAINNSREFILGHMEKKLDTARLDKFRRLTAKRCQGVPSAYLTGVKSFYGLDFKVNKNVLIPRPETEMMVEEGAKCAMQNAQCKTIIDIGTGSGCIIISLVKELLKAEFFLAGWRLLAVDISAKALKTARQNAEFHKVSRQIKFIRSDLLKKINKAAFDGPGSQLIIMANLPYVSDTWKNNAAAGAIGLKFEPKIALFAGQDGLKLYEKLFKQISRIANCQLPITLLCEIDPGQTKKIKQLIKNELPPAKLQIKKDLAKRDRLLIIAIANPFKSR